MKICDRCKKNRCNDDEIVTFSALVEKIPLGCTPFMEESIIRVEICKECQNKMLEELGCTPHDIVVK